MTGHQQHPGTARTLQQQPAPATSLEALARALGIEHIHTVDPYKLHEVEQALVACLARDEPAVIISRRSCLLNPGERRAAMPLQVQAELCNACGACWQVGCPALIRGETLCERNGHRTTAIDPLLCTGCGICAQVCPTHAIVARAAVVAEQPQEQRL